MRFLLTSSGIKNASIQDALVDLLGKPISESSALFIPTGIYPFPGGASMAWQATCGKAKSPLCELGWKSLGVLELTALTTIQKESWVPAVRETDALLVWGGDVLYLCHWMKQSGLADLLPLLNKTVYVGVSAGSIVVTPGRRHELQRRRSVEKDSRKDTEGIINAVVRGSRKVPEPVFIGRRTKITH